MAQGSGRRLRRSARPRSALSTAIPGSASCGQRVGVRYAQSPALLATGSHQDVARKAFSEKTRRDSFDPLHIQARYVEVIHHLSRVTILKQKQRSRNTSPHRRQSHAHNKSREARIRSRTVKPLNESHSLTPQSKQFRLTQSASRT
ncbi:hypothetical protein OBG92_02853 [Pseudomonas paraeruginosa]|nr:hypothetical protein OBG92_02853 [Pseudomonas aeruginosa]